LLTKKNDNSVLFEILEFLENLLAPDLVLFEPFLLVLVVALAVGLLYLFVLELVEVVE
jgi:uncharacterized membrane protein (DUF106 family)